MSRIRDIFGCVENDQKIDRLIQKYANKEEAYALMLSDELEKELLDLNYVNSMGVTYKVKPGYLSREN